MKTRVETKHEPAARDADGCRAEAEAEAALHRFTNLLNSVEGIVWEADASTFKFLFVSRYAERILGYPIKRWLDEPTFWKDHIHPDDRDWAVDFCVRAIAEKKQHNFEYRMIAADGRVVWLQDIVTVVVEHDRPTQLRGVMIDVTERKRADEVQRRNEANLTELAQKLQRNEFHLSESQRLAHLGSWTFKAAGFGYWSPELFRIHGLAPSGKAPTVEEYMGLVHPEDREFVTKTIHKMFAEGRGFDFTKRIVRSDGEIRRVRCVGVASTREGTFQEFIGTGMDVTEQEELTQELRRSEAYLADAQKLSRTGSWAWSPEAGIKYWSEECYRVQGFDPRDGLPQFEKLFQRVHPDDQSKWQELMERLVPEKIDFETDYRFVLPGGAVRDIHSTGHPVIGPSGDLIEYIGTVFDVTERKRAEQELRASERKYRNLVDTIPAFVHTALPNGDLDFFNRGWLQYLGVPIADLLGWRWTAVIHPWDVEGFLNKWRATLESGEPFIAESRVRRADGEYRWFLHRKQPQRNAAGELVKWYGSSVDIHELKQAEDALRLSQACMAHAQRLSQIGSWAYRFSDEVHWYNPEHWSEELWRITDFDPSKGFPPNELIFARIHPEDRERVVEATTQTIKSGQALNVKYRYFRADGTLRVFCSIGTVIHIGDAFKRYVGATIDVTEQEELTQQLRRREAYLAEAQRLSHTGSSAWNVVTGEQIWSEENYRILGYDRTVKPSFELIRDRVHPDDLQVFQQTIARAAEGKRIDFEHRLLMPDGSVKHLHVVADGIQKDGKFVELIGTAMDITERKRAEALLTAEKNLHEMIATGVALKEILNALCLMIEEQRSGTLASVLLLGSDGMHLESLAGPGLPEGWTRQIASLPIGPCAGSCGTAAYRGSPVIVPDIATDPLWAVADHRASALSYGLRASWSYPILCSEGEVLGTVCLYYRETRSPSPNDLDLIELAVHLARVAIERKEAEEQLRRSEAFLADGQRLSHTGSWGWHAATGKLTWSQENFRILGFDPQDTTPSLDIFWERVHPDDKTALRRAFESAIRDKRDVEREYRIVTPDRSIRHLHGVGHAVLDEANELVEFIGSTVDITQRKRAEETIRRSEAFLAEGQRLSHTGSFGWNVSTDEHFWSDETFRIFEFDPSSKLSLEVILQHVHPQDLPLVKAGIAAATSAQGADLEYRLILPDGRIKYLHVVATAQRNDAGSVEIVGAVMDITARKLIEIELRRSKDYLTNAESLSRTGSVGMEVSTGRIFWSEEAARINGYPPGTQPTPELILQRVHPDDVSLMKNVLERAAQGGHDFVFEHRLLMPDGSIKFISNLAQCVRDEAGNEEIVGAIKDITEYRLAEEALRRSQAFLAEGQRLSHTGSFGWKPDTSEIIWSAETYRIFEFDRTVTPTIDLMVRCVHPEDRANFQLVIERASGGASDFEHDYRLLLPDGRTKHVYALAHATQDAFGNLEYVGAVTDMTDQKRAEEALQSTSRDLQESNARLVEAQRIAHLGYWEWDLATNRVTWAEETFRIYGLQPRGDPIELAELSEMIHPEDREFVFRTAEQALREGVRPDVEHRIVRPTGEERIIHSHGDTKKDSSGRPYQMFGTVQDITERKRAEEAIRRSEAFLAEGQRLSHTGSWGWNASSGKLTWSEEHFRILGLDSQDTTPTLDIFWERVHPDDRPALQRSFESAIKEKRNFEQEFRIVTPDWSIRHLHGVGQAVLNQVNELVEFIGSTMDITERKRSEERAESQREAIQLALNAFVEELDVNRFLNDIISEIIKQFHPKSWELWLLDEASGELSLQLSSHSADARDRVASNGNIRRPEELADLWRSKCVARTPQIFEFPVKESIPVPQHFEMLHDEGIKRLVLVPLALGEQNLGFLELHFPSSGKFTTDDLELAQALVNHATLALQLSRLARRTEQMAVTEERNRMAREIHDTLAQSFAGVVLHSEALGTALGVNKSRSKKALHNIQKLARSGLEEARRSVQALRPLALEGSTLSQALEQMAKHYSKEANFACDFKQQGAALKLSAEIQNELFRIAQEAMTNVSKHAQAKSVWITLEFKNDQVLLAVRDDGIGFAATDSSKPRGGYGLSTMRERALCIGGKLEIESTAIGGTAIRILVPSTEKEKS